MFPVPLIALCHDLEGEVVSLVSSVRAIQIGGADENGRVVWGGGSVRDPGSGLCIIFSFLLEDVFC